MSDIQIVPTVEGLSSVQLEAVAAVNRLEAKAHASEAEPSDIRWAQADEIVKLSESGMTQREIAKRWKKPDGSSYGPTHVNYTIATAVHYSEQTRDGLRWYDAYNSDAVRKPHVTQNSGENEWYTPPRYIEAARTVMGGIDLDPASSDTANTIVQATIHYTQEDDGLKRPWAGRVWMNPPYSKDLIYPFTERLCDFYASGDISEAVVLVNNATETAAFQRMAELADAICFHAGRIKYLNENLAEEHTPLQGQSFLYFGPNVEAFRTEFLAFGFVANL